MVFGSTFGCSEMLFVTSFCLSELDFSEVFPKPVVVVTLCTSHTRLRHFAFSAKRLDDVGVSRMCRSAIPLTWVTCRDNMSVCVVMLLPRVSSHSGTVEVNRCEALPIEDPRA